MTTYAIHFGWIPGHAQQGPVGIWDETGARYYPSSTSEFETIGEAHVLPVVTGQLAHSFESWLEMRSESTSAFTNWERIDSAEPMRTVLDELLTAFLSEEHPVLKLPAAGIAESAESPATDPDDASSAPDGPYAPARRRVLAESWWIASELAARHPELLVYEMHPGGGTYDCLTLASTHASESRPIFLNREGTIQVHGRDGGPTALKLTWAQALAAQSPHEVVKRIEAAAGIDLNGGRPATTARTLVYRIISAFLATQVNDRHAWDARCEFLDTSGYGGPHAGHIGRFPRAQEAARTTGDIGIPGEPESHFWAILRDAEPIAMLSIEGALFVSDDVVDLFPLYDQHGRSVSAVIARTLGKWLR